MFIDDPNLKVAWLDTMLLSLPEKPRTNGYTDWSNDIRPWNLLAEKYDRKIVMTHHCNKQGESPKDSLLGSVGIGASFEDILVIQKEGGSATLYTDGKDIDEKTYQLKKLEYGWKIGGIAQTGITGPSLDYLNTLVTQHYKKTSVGLSWSEIKKKLEAEGKSIANLSRDLNKLLENNVFEKFDGVFTPL